MKCCTKTTRPISSILPSSREPSVSPARPTPKEFAPPLPLSSKLLCRRSSERLPSIEQLNRSFRGLSATRRLPSRHVPHLQDHIIDHAGGSGRLIFLQRDDVCASRLHRVHHGGRSA